MPVIGANGNPTTGNASFAVTLTNAEDNRLAAMVLGFGPTAFGTMSVAPWIGAGCELQTDAVGLNFFVTSANAASQAFPIPAGPAFAGLHVYGQWLVRGAGKGPCWARHTASAPSGDRPARRPATVPPTVAGATPARACFWARPQQ